MINFPSGFDIPLFISDICVLVAPFLGLAALIAAAYVIMNILKKV